VRLTPQFVGALHLLKNHGYERVAAVVGAYKSTTYCTFFTIDELIADAQTHVQVSGRRPAPRPGMWTGVPNLRHMTDKDVRSRDVISLAEQIAKREDVTLALADCAWMQELLGRARIGNRIAAKTLEKMGIRQPDNEAIL
jgi:hypothetical protein